MEAVGSSEIRSPTLQAMVTAEIDMIQKLASQPAACNGLMQIRGGYEAHMYIAIFGEM